MLSKPRQPDRVVKIKGIKSLEKTYLECKKLVESWGYSCGNTIPVYLVSQHESPTEDFDDIASMYLGLYPLGTVNKRDGEDKVFEKLISLVSSAGFEDWNYIVFSQGSDWGRSTNIEDTIIRRGADVDILKHCTEHISVTLALADTRERVNISALGDYDDVQTFMKYIYRYATSDILIHILNTVPRLFIKFSSIFDQDEYHKILSGVDRSGVRYLLRIDY